MRRIDESDLDYWARRHREVIELAENTAGDVRAAHIALAESYARLIEIANAGAEADQLQA